MLNLFTKKKELTILQETLLQYEQQLETNQELLRQKEQELSEAQEEIVQKEQKNIILQKKIITQEREVQSSSQYKTANIQLRENLQIMTNQIRQLTKELNEAKVESNQLAQEKQKVLSLQKQFTLLIKNKEEETERAAFMKKRKVQLQTELHEQKMLNRQQAIMLKEAQKQVTQLQEQLHIQEQKYNKQKLKLKQTSKSSTNIKTKKHETIVNEYRMQKTAENDRVNKQLELAIQHAVQTYTTPIPILKKTDTASHVSTKELSPVSTSTEKQEESLAQFLARIKKERAERNNSQSYQKFNDLTEEVYITQTVEDYEHYREYGTLPHSSAPGGNAEPDFFEPNNIDVEYEYQGNAYYDKEDVPDDYL